VFFLNTVYNNNIMFLLLFLFSSVRMYLCIFHYFYTRPLHKIMRHRLSQIPRECRDFAAIPRVPLPCHALFRRSIGFCTGLYTRVSARRNGVRTAEPSCWKIFFLLLSNWQWKGNIILKVLSTLSSDNIVWYGCTLTTKQRWMKLITIPRNTKTY